MNGCNIYCGKGETTIKGEVNPTHDEMADILINGMKCLNEHLGIVKAGMFIYMVTHNIASFKSPSINAIDAAALDNELGDA
jgi:hypothetical protein